MEMYARRFTLVMEEGSQVGATYALDYGMITIGREVDNTIVLDEPRVSRHHTRLRVSEDGSVLLEDLGSTNGTFVRGQALVGLSQLTPGETFMLGDQVRFRLVETGAEAPAPFPAAGMPATQAVSAPGYSEAAPFEPAYGQPVYDEPAYAAAPPARPPVKTSPRWLYVVIGLLVVLVCVCVAVGVYLWFAPVSFYESIFDFLGINLP